MSKKMTNKPKSEQVTKPSKNAAPAATETAVTIPAAAPALASEPARETSAPVAEKPAASPRESRNGITKPKVGSICASIWDTCDALLAAGQEVTFAALKEKLSNVNDATIRTQRQRHKSFHAKPTK